MKPVTDLTISCDETTDHDFTHEDCTGEFTTLSWGSWPVRELHGICSCACHEKAATQGELDV